MSDYDDDLKDEEQWARDLDDLPMIREAAEWERRLRALVSRTGKNREIVLSYRLRLVRKAVKFRPDMPEAQASAWVDRVIGLEPAH